MARPESISIPQQAPEQGPRRILNHPIHASAVEQALRNKTLRKDHYFLEDKDGLHLGTLNAVLVSQDDTYVFVLNNGEELPQAADAELQLFEPVSIAGLGDLVGGDYLFQGTHGRLATMVDPYDRLGEGQVKVYFDGQSEPSVFYRNDPEWSDFKAYRAAHI